MNTIEKHFYDTIFHKSAAQYRHKNKDTEFPDKNMLKNWNNVSFHFYFLDLFSHPITRCHLWSSSLIGSTVTSRSFLHQNNNIQWNLKLWGELLTWKLLHMLDFVTDFASCHLLFVSCWLHNVPPPSSTHLFITYDRVLMQINFSLCTNTSFYISVWLWNTSAY